MHKPRLTIFTIVLLCITFLGVWPLWAQEPSLRGSGLEAQGSSLRWHVLENQQVVLNAPGTGDRWLASAKPILAPKVQKEVDKGRANLGAGKFEDAQSQFEKAYKAAPGNPEVNFLLGLSFMAAGQTNQADTYLSRAYSIYPHDPRILTAIGILRTKQDQFESAVSALEAAIQLKHDMYLPHMALATVFLLDGNLDGSLSEARLALKLGKGDDTAHKAKFIVGASLAGLGKTSEAVKPLQEFIEDFPDDPVVPTAKKIMTAIQATPSQTMLTGPDGP